MKRRASAKQIAWRKKFAERFGKKKRARKNPARRKTKGKRKYNSRGYTVGRGKLRRYKQNPRKRSSIMARRKRRTRRAKSSIKRRYARRNPIRSHRRRRRYRRNPIFGSSGGGISLTVASVKNTVVNGAVGALGGIGVDLLYGYGAQYLPDSMKTGMVKHATKGLMAVLVGLIGAKVLRGKGAALAVGGMTVVLHDFFKEQLQAQMPTLPLGEYLAYSAGSGEIVGQYGAQGLGALPDQNMNSLGFNSFETNTLGEYMDVNGSGGFY